MKEISTENLSQLDNRYRTTAIIYFTQIFSTVILIIAGLFVTDGSENKSGSSSLTTLWVAVIFIAIGAFVLRRALFKWDRLKNAKLLRGVSGVYKTLQTNSVILGALAEIISVIGFVIAASSGEKADLLRAGLVSLIVFLISFPRKSVWRKIASSLEEV